MFQALPIAHYSRAVFFRQKEIRNFPASKEQWKLLEVHHLVLLVALKS
jgi:hypothetical protein